MDVADGVAQPGQFDVDPVRTDTYALSDIDAALSLLADSKECGKVMVEMSKG